MSSISFKVEDIKLTYGFVLIEPLEVEGAEGKDSLMVTTTSEDKPYVGKIVNSSVDDYIEGTIVLVGMHYTSTISINNKFYYSCHFQDILGKIEKKSNN